nr:MAG TPA: hypothetical protein [Bacteriophage sp.]
MISSLHLRQPATTAAWEGSLRMLESGFAPCSGRED